MKRCKVVVYGSLVVLLGLMAPRMVSAQDTTLDKPYKEQLVLVEGKLRSGNIAGALETLDDVIAKYPKAAEVYYAKALLFGQARNFNIAIPVAQQAVALEPSNLVFSNYLVGLYKGNNDLNSALGVIDSSIHYHPENVVLYREKMMVLHHAKRSEEALTIYDSTRERFGVSDTLDIIKGEILVDLERNEEAEQLLLPWAAKGSKIRQVYSTLGYLYLDKKKVKPAIQILERGLANTGENILYFDLADAYAASKKDKQAFDCLSKAFDASDVDFPEKYRVMITALSGKTALSLDQVQTLANLLVLRHPRVADSHVAKGEVLWRRGNLQEARSLFLTAVSMNRGHVDAWRMLMNVELALNQVDDAIAHGFEALESNRNNPMLLYFTGLAYMVKDDTENARKMLETALDNSGDENTYVQSLIYAGLGDLYHKLKMSDVSDVAYEEAIKLDSTNATAMNNYAYYLSERNEKLDLAEKLSRNSNELDPTSSTFQDTYAWVLFKQGKYSEALKWIEKAVAGGQPSAVLYEHYGDILYKNGNSKEAVKQWEKALSSNTEAGIDMDKLKSKITKRSYVE